MSEGYFTQTIDDSGQTYQHQVKNSFDGSTLNEDNLIITEDPELRHILKIAENVARSKATVLIQGESGTGKELLASYIHKNSQCDGAYIAVNCAALPEQLAESELFGHERGSFTGAVKRKIGKFESAHSGTIVLDEITELTMPLQAKLLRVLQEKSIDRVGGNGSIPVDYRLIAISNIDLKQAVLEGKFREDLYYRINVIPLTIPPLRNRKKDIRLLSEKYLKKFQAVYKKNVLCFSEHAQSILAENYWKGNVRELINAIERAVLLAEKDTIEVHDLGISQSLGHELQSPVIVKGITIKEMEQKLIAHTLNEVNDNRTKAAERLGISIRTLRNKLKEYKENSAECKNVSII